MELDLQIYFGFMGTAVLIGRDPRNPSPRIRAHIRLRFWSAKIDDICLGPPGPRLNILNIL